ncbi:hypothetical protein EAb13_CDS0010 [Acinetobacter phage EAb13]|nr:hypothetical protein EAb13_CDS0010 [Acinetobacter phage EAb13]
MVRKYVGFFGVRAVYEVRVGVQVGVMSRPQPLFCTVMVQKRRI